MKFKVGMPPIQKVLTDPIHIALSDCGGYEGIQLLLRSVAGLNGPCKDILAVDPNGNVWSGESFSFLLGNFTEDGVFHFNPRIKALHD